MSGEFCKKLKRIVSLLPNVFEHVRQSNSNVVHPTHGLRKLRPEPKKINVFTEEQVERLLDPKTNEAIRDQIIVGLPCYAGLRASEVLGLQWQRVSLENSKSTIHVLQTVLDGEVRETTKSGKDRFVPISKN